MSPDPTANSTVDEEFRSLLEGLRTSIPAVQVLFAFLLTAPLQEGFGRLSNVERCSFAIAFYASGTASVLLVAPSVHQRLRAPFTGVRRHSKRHLIWATWLGILGSLSALLAVSATVFLVSDVVFDTAVASVATTAMAVLACWSWLFLPMVTFRTSDR